MKRRTYGRDVGLTLRMLATTGLLGLLYVVFAVVLFQVLSVGLIPMIVIVVGIAAFQYFTSDKLALKASGAKVVTEQEAPELHAMVERLCAKAFGTSVSITATFGFGRSAIAQSRSTIAWSSGASFSDTTLAPAALSASLSDV